MIRRRRFWGKAGNDPEAAKDRLILDQFQRFQLMELEVSLNAESTMPKRVKTTYRRNAVRIAVQNVTAGNIGDSLQLVSIAKRLTQELDPVEAQAFNRQLDSAVEQQLQTFRQRLLEDGRLAAVDYDELLKRCRVAQIGQQQDAYSTGLQFLLTECELETKATKVTPPPEAATNIHENYVRAIWEHRWGDRDDGVPVGQRHLQDFAHELREAWRSPAEQSWGGARRAGVRDVDER